MQKEMRLYKRILKRIQKGKGSDYSGILIENAYKHKKECMYQNEYVTHRQTHKTTGNTKILRKRKTRITFNNLENVFQIDFFVNSYSYSVSVCSCARNMFQFQFKFYYNILQGI